jgi:fatty acid elongase 3
MAIADIFVSVASNRSQPLPSYLTHYEKGVTPLSTTPVVFSVIAVYLATIFSIKQFMKGRPPFKFTLLFQAHNIVLTLGSGLLLALIIEEAAPILLKDGLLNAICDTQSWTPVRRYALVLRKICSLIVLYLLLAA